MTAARTYHTATLLPDGTVLVAGAVSSANSAELYDPNTGTWSATGSMNQGRHDFTATLLPDGTVLVTAYEGSDSAELYDPSTGSWSATASMAPCAPRVVPRHVAARRHGAGRRQSPQRPIARGALRPADQDVGSSAGLGGSPTVRHGQASLP